MKPPIGQCENNLKQIGLALHAYHGDNDSFPATYAPYPGGVPFGTTPPCWAWPISHLPYLEQGTLYRALNPLNVPIPTVAATNPSLFQLPVKTFLCPSDPPGTMGPYLNDNYPWQAASTLPIIYVAKFELCGQRGSRCNCKSNSMWNLQKYSRYNDKNH